MTELAVLTADEAEILVDCEETISHHLQTFVEVGTALTLIRDNRLYRATHGTFESYVADRWGIVDSRARQLIIAAQTVTTVTAAGLPAPANERQARELARVPEPERAAVWQAANEATAGKPTAAAIRTAAQPTETAARDDLPLADGTETDSGAALVHPLAGRGPTDGEPVPAPAAVPGGTAAGVTPDLDPDESHREWLRQFAERAAAVRAGRESFATFAADFPPDAMAICAGPYEVGLMAALEASQGHDPDEFAATLDRLVPDDNPHREWQAKFLDAISSTYRITRFTPEDVAERADEELVGELIRVIDLLDDYRLRVVNARIASRPHNVTPIRRAQ